MRKIITILFAGVLLVSFAACGGSKKDEKSEQATETTEVKADPEAEAVDAEKALKDFESYVERYAEIIKKMKAGDVSIAGEYSQLSQQKKQYDADLARYEAGFDAAQKQRWEDARTKLNGAVKSLSEKK
ncbi:MAG: hypothetical protein LBJ72_08160 [Dysgonamonadaceae bacterium]|jgi:ABC-type phosphate/phosphonate transport system substrate-binding protein|nr:hypothetical protein [Dysgonamonadaceae bacterium]